MEFKYDGKSLRPGVYKIMNSQNNRVYFGSAKRFKERWRKHANDLKNQRHGNRFLQADWNKCGSSAFVFEVLEVVEGDKAQRLAAEQQCLDRYYDNGKACYNLRKDAIGTREGHANIDYRRKMPPMSMKARKNHSKASKKIWKNPVIREKISNGVSKWARKRFSNPAECEKLSRERMGQKNPMFGRIGRQNKNSTPIEQVCLKTGQVIAVFDSITFAEKTLGIHNISSVLSGKYKSAGSYFWRRLAL